MDMWGKDKSKQFKSYGFSKETFEQHACTDEYGKALKEATDKMQSAIIRAHHIVTQEAFDKGEKITLEEFNNRVNKLLELNLHGLDNICRKQGWYIDNETSDHVKFVNDKEIERETQETEREE